MRPMRPVFRALFRGIFRHRPNGAKDRIIAGFLRVANQ
jgi:hypothetical protein